MSDIAPPEGFVLAEFSPGFLDHGGPYFFKDRGADQPKLAALRICEHHINYQDAAHGGAISTFADMALSHAIYDAQRPRLLPSTITLQVNYLRGPKLGDWLEADVTIDRIGGRTAYSSGRICLGDEVVATMNAVFSIKRP